MRWHVCLVAFLVIVTGGCQSTESARHQTDIRLFSQDLNGSIQKVAQSGAGEDTRLSYGCYSDRPFKQLPFAELAEVGNALAAIKRVTESSQTLTPAERTSILLEYSTKGVPMAQFLTGASFLESAQVRDNEELGAEYVRRSALQGCPPAQALLAFLYWQGIGLGTDKAKAYGWADSASFAGLETATKLRNEIAPHLTPSELEEAKRISAPWRR